MQYKLSGLLSKSQLIVVIIVFVAVVLLGYFTFFTPNHFEQNSPVTFEVRIAEPFSSVVERLYQQKIIPSKFNFRVAAFLYGAEKKIKAARFKIPNDLS